MKIFSQAETYRRMKRAVGDNWQGFFPQTNCLWIHYLSDVFLASKQIPLTKSEKQDIRIFKSVS